MLVYFSPTILFGVYCQKNVLRTLVILIQIFKLFSEFHIHQSRKPELLSSIILMFVAGQNLGMYTKKTEVAIQSNFPAEINDP